MTDIRSLKAVVGLVPVGGRRGIIDVDRRRWPQEALYVRLSLEQVGLRPYYARYSVDSNAASIHAREEGSEDKANPESREASGPGQCERTGTTKATHKI